MLLKVETSYDDRYSDQLLLYGRFSTKALNFKEFFLAFN